MELLIVLLIAAVVPTIIELHRDGLHRLDWRDAMRGLGSQRP